MLGDVSIFLVGKDEYDELACKPPLFSLSLSQLVSDFILNLLAVAEAIFIITGAVKDICGKPPTERVFLDKYGRICLCLDEIVWNGLLENTDKDRIKRLIRLKPPSEF